MNRPNDEVTRRDLVLHFALFAALGAAGVLPAMAEDRSQSDPGPSNAVLGGQNLDSTLPPATDSKSLIQNFKYPFSVANKRT